MFASTQSRATDPIGFKPSYILGGVSSVPNQQAIPKKIWAPGLDDGFVPQGLTTAPGLVLIAGYKSTDPKVGSGPCRVFSVSTVDGRLTGYFDLPDDCGHAGGLAVLGDGTIVVSDTRTLYKIESPRNLRRLQALREWSHEEIKQVFPRDARASRSNGARASSRLSVVVGGRRVHGTEGWVRAADAARMGA